MLDESVARAVVAAHRGPHPGLAQPPAVQLALVAHRVVLPGDDECRRESGEVRPLDRRDERVVGVGSTVQVEGVERLQPRRLQAIAHRVLPQRGVAVDVEVQVERGVVEDLVGDPVEAVVVCPGGDGGGEGAAGAVARDGQGRAVPAQAPPFLGDPAHDGVAVVETGREGGLGGQPVADGDDLEPGLLRQRTRDVVVRLQAAEEEGATVEVDQHAVGVGLVRRVDAYGNVAGRGGHGGVRHGVERQTLVHGGDVRLVRGAYRDRVERPLGRGGQTGEELGDLRVQGHGRHSWAAAAAGF